jgi:lysophospholipase L1-like esterase
MRQGEAMWVLSLALAAVASAAIFIGSSEAASDTGSIRCSNATSGWGSNVTCPAGSLGCVARKIGSPRNGFPWSCKMPAVSAGSPPGKYTVCSTGAPFPLSTGKKNVLIIGDSVSNGYFLEGTPGTNVPELLSDVALTQHAPFSPGSGGAGPTSHGMDCLEVYLQLANGQAAHYDVITFNFGLHDLGNTTADLATYSKQLSDIADRLVRTKSKLLYLMTTPMMPECCGGAALLPSSEGAPVPKCREGASATYRCDSVVVQLNAAAAKIMEARNIPTLDLHKTVTDICAPQPPHIYTNCSICRMEPCSYHYNPGGYAHISKPIATAVRQLL